MTTMPAPKPQQPAQRPARPNFSSGPCAKRPGWRPDVLRNALIGRSHRSDEGKQRLHQLIEKTKALLELPADYRAAIIPGSNTGAFELALWSMLGARGVDVLAWESFGKGWITDITEQLRLTNVRTIEADYGKLPDLRHVDFRRDVIFTWNGTTSGVRIPDAEWIPENKEGLTFVDATSAVFAQPIDWKKVDVATFSWQKVLGGEAAHGMLILSPRAVERLKTYQPPWPLPKLFRLTSKGKLNEAVFQGHTINTPSMLCVEDGLDALSWIESIGGLKSAISRCNANANVLFDWIAQTPWVANLADDPATWSNTSVCLKVVEPEIATQPKETQSRFSKEIARLLDDENVAKDIGAYRDAPAGLRIWTGVTIEKTDLQILTPWLDWAYQHVKSTIAPSK